MTTNRKLRGLVQSATAAALVLAGLTTGPAPALAAVPRDGASASTAAASCWEIKQNNSAAANGTYWLVTPQMAAPAEFYCDMTTDGGGWVLIGKGREGWKHAYEGNGSAAALRTAGLSPMSNATSQYSSVLIDGLLNGGRVDALTDGIRLKRAKDAAGLTWQDARFQMSKRDRWVWTFGAEHPLAWVTFDGVPSVGSLTSNFGSDNGYNRVNINTQAVANQGYTIGFSYGSLISGTSNSDTYLWSATNGLGSARPYTEVFIRPKVTSSDPGFTPIGDSGTAAKTNVGVAESVALDSPWGVTGAVTPKREGDVEVQDFVQSGNRMYVGGNFTSVQRTANATGADRVSQSFVAAFDVNTGELIREFAPQLNGSVMALVALPNGNIVAGGHFTAANGAPATGIVALNPNTGATASGWNLKIEDRTAAGVLRISDMSVRGNWLYLGGAFTHLAGGTRPDTFVFARSAARISVSDYTPGTNWNPDFNGTVVEVDASDDGSRLYAAGYFSTSRAVSAYKAAAVQTATGAPLATPAWNPVWSSTRKDYQQTIGQVGSRVWVGGSEHSFFSYSTSTFERLSGDIGKQNGDFQSMAESTNGIVYAGSHGHDYNYSNAFFWPSVGTEWTQAHSFEYTGAWDAATGAFIPHFTPALGFRLGQGIWASVVDSNGTYWAGGDMNRARTRTSGTKWSGGFARFPQRDATAPTRPSNPRASEDTASTVRITWTGSTDNRGPVSYQILRDDRVIATTSGTSLVVPKDGNNRFFVRATDGAGNLSASTSVITPQTTVNQPPVASFTSSVNGLAVSVNGSGSSDPDGTISSYAWTFGDGGTATGVTASRTYAAAGTYNIKLTVTDNSGASAERTASVTVSSAPAGSEETVLIPAKSTWSWRYEPTAPPSTWKDKAFDASTWKSGPAVLGFGSTGLGTDVDFTPETTTDRPLAAYFIRQFTVDSAAAVTKLTLRTVADDGVVVYVNGTEVGRSNMPTGTIGFGSYATSAVNTSTANLSPVVLDVPLSLLVSGTNTIAVETHLNYRATRDMSMDLTATATVTK